MRFMSMTVLLLVMRPVVSSPEPRPEPKPEPNPLPSPMNEQGSGSGSVAGISNGQWLTFASGMTAMCVAAGFAYANLKISKSNSALAHKVAEFNEKKEKFAITIVSIEKLIEGVEKQLNVLKDKDIQEEDQKSLLTYLQQSHGKISLQFQQDRGNQAQTMDGQLLMTKYCPLVDGMSDNIVKLYDSLVKTPPGSRANSNSNSPQGSGRNSPQVSAMGSNDTPSRRGSLSSGSRRNSVSNPAPQSPVLGQKKTGNTTPPPQTKPGAPLGRTQTSSTTSTTGLIAAEEGKGKGPAGKPVPLQNMQSIQQGAQSTSVAPAGPLPVQRKNSIKTKGNEVKPTTRPSTPTLRKRMARSALRSRMLHFDM